MCNNNYGYFYDKGVELQMQSNSWWQAKRNYLYSCMLCCTRNAGICRCDHCPIREALLVNADIFSQKMPKQEQDWVEKEKKLL